MDFIPFDTDFFSPSFYLYFVGTPVMAASVITSMAMKEKLGRAIRGALFGLGAAGAVAMLASAPASFIEYNETQTDRAELRQEIADGFSEHYGVKVTAENVVELDYPFRDPGEEMVAGTTTLGSGMKVTLVVDDGKARLYRLGEELPVAD